MKNSAYSPLKIFRHPTILQALRQGVPASPIHLQLVPTNRCNQGCLGCAYRMKGYPSNEQFQEQDEIPWSKLQEIIEDCRSMGVRAIELTGGGEPTVHPHFLDLGYLICDSGIDLGIVTNGSLWTPEHTHLALKAKWVRFSLDAGSADTYAAWRRVPRNVYGQVRSSLQRLTAAKENDNPLIGVGFVVNRNNWKEALVAAQRAKADGADNFRISALFTRGGSKYFTSFRHRAAELCRKAEQLNTERFHVFNLFDNRLDDLDDGKSAIPFCGYSRLVTYLGADQVVYSCCINAYNQTGQLGSIQDTSFQALWFSDAFQGRLQSIEPRHCKRCMFTEKNRLIAYAVDPHPQHVNFI